ncbi:MAG: TolC family protein [Bacteroidales bacterium]|jgi:outer membrane protein TolC|nr:TolC family protein [Bacteroidales bacterium]
MVKFMMAALILLPFHAAAANSLTDYLEIAARNNPVIKSDFLAYQAALQKIPQMGAFESPKLDIGVFIKPMEIVDGRQVADFTLMQMFPWFGTRKTARTEAQHMAKMAFEQFRETRDNLFLEVSTQWYVLCSLQQKFINNEEHLSLLKQLEELTLRKYAFSAATSPSGVASAKPSASTPAKTGGDNMAGMGMGGGGTQATAASSENMAAMGNSGAMSSSTASMADVLRIRLETVELENNIESIQSEMTAEKAKFNALLNRVAESEVTIPHSFEQTAFLFDITSVMDKITRQNPMLEMITQENLAYKAKGEMDKKMSYPMFGIGLQYMLINKNVNSMSSMNDMNGKDMIMPMVSVSIPIYRGKYKAQQRESVLLQQSAQERYTNTLNGLGAELYRAKHRLDDAERKIALYQKQSELAHTTYHLLVQEFVSGKSDLTNVIQVQRQLLDYRLKKSEATAEYNTSVANIQKMISTTDNEDNE